MIWEQLDNHLQKDKSDSMPDTVYQNQLQMEQRYKCKKMKPYKY